MNNDSCNQWNSIEVWMFTVAEKSKNNTEKVEHTPTCISARLYSQN